MFGAGLGVKSDFQTVVKAGTAPAATRFSCGENPSLKGSKGGNRAKLLFTFSMKSVRMIPL